jgi:hypothetical protein
MLYRCALGAGTLALAVVAICLLVGCGSTQGQATLPPGLVTRLASASDAVAADLGRGDMCAAASHAASLQSAAAAAVRTGQVPSTLAPELTRRIRSLAAAIQCTPPAPAVEQQPQEDEEQHDRGKHNGKEKHGQDGKGDKG